MAEGLIYEQYEQLLNEKKGKWPTTKLSNYSYTLSKTNNHKSIWRITTSLIVDTEFSKTSTVLLDAVNEIFSTQQVWSDTCNILNA